MAPFEQDLFLENSMSTRRRRRAEQRSLNNDQALRHVSAEPPRC